MVFGQITIMTRFTLVQKSKGDLVAQAVRRSPPTAGVPSSRLGPSTWVSWWTKRGLGRFFTGFLPFSPTTNFIPPSLHTHLIRFISSALVMVRQAWSAGTLATHGPILWGLHRISSLDPTLCWTRVEVIYLQKSKKGHCSQMFSASLYCRQIVESKTDKFYVKYKLNMAVTNGMFGV